MRPIALLTALIVSTSSVPPTPDSSAVRVMWEGVYQPMVERMIQAIIYSQPEMHDDQPAADVQPDDDGEQMQPAGPPVPEQPDGDGDDDPAPDENGNYAT